MEALKKFVYLVSRLFADLPAQVQLHTDHSYLVTSPNIQRVIVYERRVAAPPQRAHRCVSLRSIHPSNPDFRLRLSAC